MTARQCRRFAECREIRAETDTAEQMAEYVARTTVMIAHVIGQIDVLCHKMFVTIALDRLMGHGGPMGVRFRGRSGLPAEFRREHGQQHDHHQEAKHDAH